MTTQANEQRLKEVEKLLEQCEKDMQRLEKLHAEMAEIEANRAALEIYYDSDYMRDFDAAEESGVYYAMLDEDSIWNVLTSQYQEKIAMLKSITQSL